MLTVLVESRRRRERSLAGTVFSVWAHAALIGVAIVATARGESPPIAQEPRETAVIFVAPPDRHREAGGGGGGPVSGPVESVVRAPDLPTVGIPDPSIDLAMPDVPLGPYGDPELPVISRSHGARAGGADEPFFEWMVDVSARPLPGNPRPDYPRLLRSSGVEGRVLAQFVIDTAGRADMRTFRVLHADHSLFERAVREAVAGMRFTSAESGGKKVRVLVQQSFAFRIAAGKALTPPPPPPETSPASSAPETPSL